MNLDIRFYWWLIVRRMPMMALFVLLCGGLGVIAALKLPETFSTSARLLVEAPQISDDLVASTVRTDAIEQLDVIEQRLMTRANLVDIANRANVFEDIRGMDPDAVVTAMREATRIRRSAGRDQATLMTIGFEARSGAIAQAVVNEYVTLVLQANVDFRLSRAESTLDFFEEEVRRIGAELDQESVEIVTFRSANAEALPEDQSFRMTRQTLLQERLSRLERDLAAAEAQRRDIVAIFETTGSLGPAGLRPATAEESQLLVARAELEQLRAEYDETNPRIVRLRNRVDRLEAIVAAQVAAQVPAGDGATSPEEAMLAATLSEIDNRVEGMSQELEETRAEIGQLAAAIVASSANGIQLAALERDYEATQMRYAAAVENLNAARLGERIETTAQGQRITVIENANVPSQPTGPDRVRIIAMGLAAGLGLAGGWFVLLELLNRAIRRPAEIRSRFGITPIAAIPYMESRGRRLARRAGLATAMLVVVAGVPAALWYVDQTYLPLDIVVQRGLDRRGRG